MEITVAKSADSALEFKEQLTVFIKNWRRIQEKYIPLVQ